MSLTKIFTVAEMIAVEKATDAAGISYNQMMENAGRGLAETISDNYPVAGMKILVLVGPGNNGGDGLVAGRYLAEAGADVAFYLFRQRDPAKDVNFAKIQTMGLFAVTADFDQRYRVLRTRLAITDLIIDGLLGTGVARPIGGDLAKLMQQIHAGINGRRAAFQQPAPRSRISLTNPDFASEKSPASLPVIAIDCPSGLNCDSGALDELAVPADLTITFAGAKRGHFQFPGAAACGELIVADIGVPPDLAAQTAVAVEIATPSTIRALLPQRPADGHKGTFGTALIAAGSAHYWGAPLLAGQGAYRAGAGLVALAVPQVIRGNIAGQLPEATYPPVPDRELLTSASFTFLQEQTNAKALLVGPGLDKATDFMQALLDTNKLPPLIIDADGLNQLPPIANWAQKLPPNTILTPHPGEMSRLMGVSLNDLKAMERITLAQQQAQTWGHIVLLKGAYTVIAAPDGRCTVLPFANPALGVAGSGDVLAGIIVGLLAQGIAPYETAVLGGYLHGLAGQIAGEWVAGSGLLASEIAAAVPQARQRLLAN